MPDQIQMLIDMALAEDIGTGDITTEVVLGKSPAVKTGVFIAKQNLVLAGMEIARRVFTTVDSQIQWKRFFEDGARVDEGQKVAEVRGSMDVLLRAERVALNFLQHLSGIATFTRLFVAKVKDYPVKILDTRKTTPGMRALEKHAVRMGGGKNHRLGLYDRFLIKDNHLKGISIGEAVKRVKEKNINKVPIEVEVGSMDQVEAAIGAGADILLLDNFSLKDLHVIVKRARETAGAKPLLEASGGITLDNVVDYAKSGVDLISIGALTHSAPAADISMQIN